MDHGEIGLNTVLALFLVMVESNIESENVITPKPSMVADRVKDQTDGNVVVLTIDVQVKKYLNNFNNKLSLVALLLQANLSLDLRYKNMIIITLHY